MNLQTCKSQTQQTASSIVPLQSRLKVQGKPRLVKCGNVVYIQDTPWPIDFSVFREGNRHNQQVHQLTRFLASVFQPGWTREDFIKAAQKESLRELQEIANPRSKKEIIRDANSVALWCYGQYRLGQFRRPCWGEYIGPCRKVGLTDRSMELSERQSIGAKFGNNKRRESTLDKLVKVIQQRGFPRTKAQLAEWSGLSINTIYRHWGDLKNLSSGVYMNGGEEREEGEEGEEGEEESEAKKLPCEEGFAVREPDEADVTAKSVTDELMMDDIPNVIELSVFPNVEAKRSRDLRLRWRDFCQLLESCAWELKVESKDDQSGMVLAGLDGKSRAKSNVKRGSSLLALDFDHPCRDLQEVVDDLSEVDIAAVGYETFSSTETQQKYRIVIPTNGELKKPKEREKWMQVIGRLIEEQPDLSCTDPSRIHYLPSNDSRVVQGRGRSALEVQEQSYDPWFRLTREPFMEVRRQRREWEERKLKKLSSEEWVIQNIYYGNREAYERVQLAKAAGGWEMLDLIEEFDPELYEALLEQRERDKPRQETSPSTADSAPELTPEVDEDDDWSYLRIGRTRVWERRV